MGQVTLSVRIDESMQETLEGLAAKRRGVEGYEGTVSELVRQVLGEHIDRETLLEEIASSGEVLGIPPELDFANQGGCPLCSPEEGCTCSIYGGEEPPIAPCFVSNGIEEEREIKARMREQEERMLAVQRYEGESLAREVFRVVTREEWNSIPDELLSNPFGGHVRTIDKRGQVPTIQYGTPSFKRPQVGPFNIASERSWDVWEDLRDHAERKIRGTIAASETNEALSLIASSTNLTHTLLAGDIWDGSAFGLACRLLWEDDLVPYGVIFHPRKNGLVNDWRNVESEEVEWPNGQNARDLVLMPSSFCPMDQVYFVVAPEKLGYLIIDNDVSFRDNPQPTMLKDGLVGWERIGMCVFNTTGIVRVEERPLR